MIRCAVPLIRGGRERLKDMKQHLSEDSTGSDKGDQKCLIMP